MEMFSVGKYLTLNFWEFGEKQSVDIFIIVTAGCFYGQKVFALNIRYLETVSDSQMKHFLYQQSSRERFLRALQKSRSLKPS